MPYVARTDTYMLYVHTKTYIHTDMHENPWGFNYVRTHAGSFFSGMKMGGVRLLASYLSEAEICRRRRLHARFLYGFGGPSKVCLEISNGESLQGWARLSSSFPQTAQSFFSFSANTLDRRLNHILNSDLAKKNRSKFWQ